MWPPGEISLQFYLKPVSSYEKHDTNTCDTGCAKRVRAVCNRMMRIKKFMDTVCNSDNEISAMCVAL